jgi:hypothetical protein
LVVSDDGRELLGIDAGTRPDSAKTAYEALRAFAPGPAGTDDYLHRTLQPRQRTQLANAAPRRQTDAEALTSAILPVDPATLGKWRGSTEGKKHPRAILLD